MKVSTKWFSILYKRVRVILRRVGDYKFRWVSQVKGLTVIKMLAEEFSLGMWVVGERVRNLFWG
jgi:hypothetical protein